LKIPENIHEPQEHMLTLYFYNYLCNQCLSPLKLWVWTLFMSRCIWYNIIW